MSKGKALQKRQSTTRKETAMTKETKSERLLEDIAKRIKELMKDGVE